MTWKPSAQVTSDLHGGPWGLLQGALTASFIVPRTQSTGRQLPRPKRNLLFQMFLVSILTRFYVDSNNDWVGNGFSTVYTGPAPSSSLGKDKT